MTTNGWPGKPGVPLKPEQEGEHWLSYRGLSEEIFVCGEWNTQRQQWFFPGDDEPRSPRKFNSDWSYHGPILTPSEQVTRDAATRRAALEEAAQDEETVERVARALWREGHPEDDGFSEAAPNDWEKWPETPRQASLTYEDHSREEYRDQARAALRALADKAAP